MSKTSTTFPLPQKNTFGVRVETNTKKLESNNYAGTLPWKVFVASQGHWNNQTIFGNVKFAISQWPNSHTFNFSTKRDYIAVTQL